MKILAITSSGSGGDLPPVIAVAEELHRRGHEVLVSGDPDSEVMLRAAGLKVSCIPNGLDWRRYLNIWLRRVEELGREKAGRFPFPMWADARIPFARRIFDQFQPDILIGQLLQVDVIYRLAVETSTPWCFINPAFYVGKHYVRSFEEDFDEILAQIHSEHWWPMIERSDLVLHATDSEFDFQPPMMESNHHYVGPLFWEPPADELSYLNEPGPSWVLATLSSDSMQDEMLLAKAIVGALRDEPLRAVLTMSSEHPKSDLGFTPANIRIEEFVPHSQVLKEGRLFISHGGHNSVMKALYYGVPMVLIPWARDQVGVGARAEKLGVAKVVKREELSVATLRSAIREVLSEPRYLAHSQDASERLQKTDWADLACRYIEDAMA